MNIFPKPVIVLDCPDSALFCHTDVEDFHYHEQVPSETGQFSTDYQIVLLHFVQEFAKFTFVVILCSADGLFYPSIDVDLFLCDKIVYLEPLVLDGLLVATDPNVTIYHKFRV